ncbi:alpha-D-ribose 1-methylphosphonate 5-triphosphate diphosphatase [Mucilaginibacter jinjuensis]|uniref:Alpha-D-ribose 1-methylphosphonate 5-triphosphate diphosphatase n=1 Tax=Mucilaginibacter jinjuensis TaxID=1176721 RepID=A0ABY7TE33_9SPHI|nr:alpha-D-ribose 1-methylphosphonate 5-triphosphate diphosphatase [Mucilaginibacter jinjuensis]WCT14613.1 alpha-D-ribose 1-methylphosphonate 5-triphosphate diphosphatase [Mucilaginibacter jinjuensis]
MNSFIIYNATIITPNEVIEKASLLVEDGVIASIDRANILSDNDCDLIDAQGAMLMPGIIDIHTDALDAEIIPRPGADIPVAIAFRELERKMSGCGFTTVYHSLHMGYEVAELHSRSKYTRSEVFDTVHRSSIGQTLLNNKIHLRYELSGVYSYDAVIELIDKGYVSMLSVMDHTPGQGQYPKPVFMAQMLKQGKTEEQALEEYEERISRPKISGEKLEALIQHAVKKGIAVASHDDDTVEKVNLMHGMGVNICEFPINLETAEHAINLGMHVVGGASNILRGGSLTGNASMTEAVTKGVVDTLCSDYYPPAILHSIFKLHQQEGLTLPDAVKLASLHPAKAAGIGNQTGSIEEGKDADLLIVRMVDNIPMVTHTIVRGNVVSQAALKAPEEKFQTAF